jgi:hypothetical protein
MSATFVKNSARSQATTASSHLITHVLNAPVKPPSTIAKSIRI